jgi:hypothetical protein
VSNDSTPPKGVRASFWWRSCRAAAGIVLCLAPGAAVAAEGEPQSEPQVERVIRIDDLDESSGLAVSPGHDGVLWTHNDSGDDARIFAVGRDGHAAATIDLADTEARDNEAIQALPPPAPGAPGLIILGDIGDNDAERDGKKRPFLTVLAEPGELRDQTVQPLAQIELTYPEGPRDAEALLADPRDNRLYVVTKGLLGGRLYGVPASVWPGRRDLARLAEDGGGNGGAPLRLEATLEPLAQVPIPFVTDGTVDADGTVVLRSYSTLAVLGALDDLRAGTARIRGSVAAPDQQQGESLTLSPDGQSDGAQPARAALLGSEGLDQPVYRVPLPALEPAPSDEPSSEPSSADTSPPVLASSDRTDQGETDTSGRAGAGAVGLAGLVAAAGLGAWALSRRRQRARHGAG